MVFYSGTDGNDTCAGSAIYLAGDRNSEFALGDRNIISGSDAELIAIDGGIAGWPGLVAEFRRRGEIVVLDGDSDGVLQLSAALRGRRGIAALHIVSHGEPGALRLGSAVLSAATLPHYQTVLGDLAAALAPGGDLLLYGCNTGCGAVGAAFLDELATATGANIAASRTLTGAAARGGDWDLAAAVGVVRTAPLTSRDFAGVLVTGYTSGSDIAVNTTTTSYQDFASVATLANGGFVVTWSSNNQDGDGYGVYGQQFDAAGVAVGSEFQVNTYTTSNQQDCSVAGLTGGGFVVTWSSYGQDGSLWGIYGQRYDSTGVAVGSEFLVNTWTNHTQNCPAVTALSDGGFLVTWQSTNQDNAQGGVGVYAQRYDSSGVASGSEFLVNTTTANDQGSSSVTALSDGGYVITWTASDGQDGSGTGIFAQIYDSANATVGSELQVNTYTAGDQVLDPGVGTPGPCIATLAGGGFVVTWGSDGQDGNGTGVYAQVFDSSGTKVGSEIAVNTSTTGNQQFPSVAALPDVGFVIAWGSDNGYHDYGQLFSADGTAVGAEFVIDTTDDADYPAVAALAYGDFVATWMGGDTADNTGVYAKLFSNTAPTLSSASPSDDGTDVAISSDLTLTFSETVAAGTGAITLYQSDGTAVETFAVATGSGDDSGTVSFSGSTVTIDPGSALAYQTGYYVTVDATAVEDSAGKPYTGISDATTLNFTTTTAPANSGDGGSTTSSNENVWRSTYYDDITGNGSFWVGHGDYVNGGAGSDTVTITLAGTVWITAVEAVVGSSGADTLILATAASIAVTDVEIIIGSTGGDWVTLSNSTPVALAGFETLLGSSGADSVTLIEGNGSIIMAAIETLTGASDGNWVTLGARGGTVYLSAIETLLGGSGSDAVFLGGSGNSVSMAAIETLTGSSGADVITTGARGGSVTLASVETVIGGSGADWVTLGSSGYVTLSGIETLLGSAGADSVQLGDGGNTVVMAAIETVIGGSGLDLLTLGDRGVSVTVQGIESILGGAGADTITLSGGSAVTIRFQSASTGGDSISGFRTGADHIAIESNLRTAVDDNGNGSLEVTSRASGQITAADEIVTLTTTVSTLSDTDYTAFRTAVGALPAAVAGDTLLVIANDGANSALYAITPDANGVLDANEVTLLARFESASISGGDLT